uniref:Non-structural protein 2 n=1 Tax=Rotavirus G TaxID=183407 RepID=A0A024CEZ4_9REOV|nr:non-structural protein 2 [Rotavirus G]
MTQSVSIADFIVKTEDGYMPSDRECKVLDRFLSREQKAIREEYKSRTGMKCDLRKKMFMLTAPSRRFTQEGVVPMKELKSKTDIPSAVKRLITDWLLKTLEDDDVCEVFEDVFENKFPDVFASSDKISRFAMRLENENDLIHKNVSKAMNAFAACFHAIKPSFATEGKCTVARACEDSIILEFPVIPEHLRIGQVRGVFYKLYPLSDDLPTQGFLALKHVSNNQFQMYHGHGHVRTVPFSEVPEAVRSFAKKQKGELEKIAKDQLAVQCGQKFIKMIDDIRAGRKIEEVISDIMRFDKKQ